MHHAASRRTAVAGSILCLIGLLALAGCQEDEITHSIVPRAAEPEKTRLLGVICPHGDATWFFKLSGPESAVEAAEPAFKDFVRSVRFTGKADAPLTWTLPDGWTQVEGPKQRYATLRLGTQDKPLEATVTALGKEAADVLPNVNRWRGQIGLGPVQAAALPTMTQKFPINGDDAATLVDITGPGASNKSAAKAKTFSYQTPEGWLEAPHPEAGIVPREALFQVEGDGQTGEVSVTALGGMAGGLKMNIDRWCGQIGAPDVPEDQIGKFPKITVAGRESPYLDLKGTKGRILGVVVARGDKTWFIKMMGPSDLVEKQKAKFEEFLKSVKFDAGQGGE